MGKPWSLHGELETCRIREVKAPTQMDGLQPLPGGLVPMLALSGLAAVYPESPRYITIQ